jgi:hypothetical protein
MTWASVKSGYFPLYNVSDDLFSEKREECREREKGREREETRGDERIAPNSFLRPERKKGKRQDSPATATAEAAATSVTKRHCVLLKEKGERRRRDGV